MQRTLRAEELAGDVEGLGADDNDLLAVQQLLGHDGRKAAKEMALAIDHNLSGIAKVSFNPVSQRCYLVRLFSNAVLFVHPSTSPSRRSHRGCASACRRSVGCLLLGICLFGVPRWLCVCVSLPVCFSSGHILPSRAHPSHGASPTASKRDCAFMLSFYLQRARRTTSLRIVNRGWYWIGYYVNKEWTMMICRKKMRGCATAWR